jgi:hypothetical protein
MSFPFSDRDFDLLDVNGDGILSADELFDGLQHKYDQVCIQCRGGRLRRCPPCLHVGLI